MKIRRVDGAQVILQRIQENMIVIDEKWLYSDPLSSKNNQAWVESGGDRPRQSQIIITDKKVHIIVAINFPGDQCFEILNQGEMSMHTDISNSLKAF